MSGITLPDRVEFTESQERCVLNFIRRHENKLKHQRNVELKAQRKAAHVAKLNKGRKGRLKRRLLWSETNGCCVYCGKPVPEHLRTFDHIWPKSKGGTRDNKNLVPSCQPCNVSRGNKVPASKHAAPGWKGYVLRKEINLGLPVK